MIKKNEDSISKMKFKTPQSNAISKLWSRLKVSEARGTGVRGEVSTEKKTLQGEMRVASLQVFSKSRECVITLRLFFNSKFCFILAEKGRNVWRLLKEVGLGEGFYEKLATVSVRSPVTLVISFVRRTSFLSRIQPL